MAYTLKFPVDKNEETIFEVLDDYIDNAKQKLKIILLTEQGERIMNPLFGIGLKKYLFQNIKKDMSILENGKEVKIREQLIKNLTNQLTLFAPEIKIKDIKIESSMEEENKINISIFYIVNNSFEDDLTMSL